MKTSFPEFYGADLDSSSSCSEAETYKTTAASLLLEDLHVFSHELVKNELKVSDFLKTVKLSQFILSKSDIPGLAVNQLRESVISLGTTYVNNIVKAIDDAVSTESDAIVRRVTVGRDDGRLKRKRRNSSSDTPDKVSKRHQTKTAVQKVKKAGG